jgi:hypothetical protein
MSQRPIPADAGGGIKIAGGGICVAGGGIADITAETD